MTASGCCNEYLRRVAGVYAAVLRLIAEGTMWLRRQVAKLPVDPEVYGDDGDEYTHDYHDLTMIQAGMTFTTTFSVEKGVRRRVLCKTDPRL